MLQGGTEINLWIIKAVIPWFQSNPIVGKCQFQLKRKTNFKCLSFPNLSNHWGHQCGNYLRVPASPVLGTVALCVCVQAVQAFHSLTHSCSHLLSSNPSCLPWKGYWYFSPQLVCRTQTPEREGKKPTVLLKAEATMGPLRRQAGSIRDFQGIQKVHLDQWWMSQRDGSQLWLLTDWFLWTCQGCQGLWVGWPGWHSNLLQERQSSAPRHSSPRETWKGMTQHNLGSCFCSLSEHPVNLSV